MSALMRWNQLRQQEEALAEGECIPRADRSRGPPTPASVAGELTVATVAGRNGEDAFLELLVAYVGSKESRQWQDDLARAEHNGRCIHRAVFFVVVLFMLSLAGLAYLAFLLPDVMSESSQVAMRGLCYVGLASLLAQGALLGCLLRHRATVRRLRRDCWLLVQGVVESHCDAGTAPNPAGDCPGGS